jgi:hypothetical protein
MGRPGPLPQALPATDLDVDRVHGARVERRRYSRSYNRKMSNWFLEPQSPDDARGPFSGGTLAWLARSTTPRAAGYRNFLNRNLSMLPAGCQGNIYRHLLKERHHQDGFFELVAGRTLQELGAEIECEPKGLPSGKRPDFVARFADATVYVEAIRPVMDRELGSILSIEGPITRLVAESVPPGWAADIRALPRVGPDESKRHIRAFLRREMDLPTPTSVDEEVEIKKTFEQGDLRVVLFPQSRHGLSPSTKIAMHNAVRRKYEQLGKLDSPTLVALNMTSTTSTREDLDQALFGVTVSQIDQRGEEAGRYFQADGLFAGGRGEPTISGVLAFPVVGILRCADPALWVHPRFTGTFPQALEELEIRRAPKTGPEVSVQSARRAGVLQNLRFLEGR